MKKRILLIDDEDHFLEMMTTHIELNSEIEVIPSKWPEVAEQMIGQYQPHAVVTDTNMKVLDGIELLKQLKFLKPDLPVIVLFSGLHGSQINEQDVLSLGAKAVMSKAAAMRELIPLLKNLLLK
jgi:two-component system OmpR family response regulator